MSFWRRLFPQYACRKCKDTHIMENRYTISRCDCEGSIKAINRQLKEVAESFAKAEEEFRLKRFAKRLKP